MSQDTQHLLDLALVRLEREHELIPTMLLQLSIEAMQKAIAAYSRHTKQLKLIRSLDQKEQNEH